MTAMITPKTHVYYPSGDGQPVAETFDHLYVILITIEVLLLHLEGVQACVLGNQYLYYEEGNSKKRCAPDVMVIFGVKPGSRDNYKIWEEGQVPQIIFEITSAGTRKEDEVTKKALYAEIGVQEYWQFDPKGEWIAGKLRGFRLVQGNYVAIDNSTSLVLDLRLEVTGALISFYRLDNGEKLMIPKELKKRAARLEQTEEQLGQTQEQLGQTQEQLRQSESRLQALQAELDRLKAQLNP